MFVRLIYRIVILPSSPVRMLIGKPSRQIIHVQFETIYIFRIVSDKRRVWSVLSTSNTPVWGLAVAKKIFACPAICKTIIQQC